jgi:hypothetical protein
MTSEEARPPQPTAAAGVVGKKKLLKKLLWALIALCGGFLILVGGVIYFKDTILRKVTEYNVRSQTGMETRIGEFHLGLTSTSLLMKDFQIVNPKDFGGGAFFRVPEVYVEMDQEKATEGFLYFKELRFHLAEVNIVKNKDGKLNLDHMQEALEKSDVFRRRKTNSPSTDYKFGGIDRMSLTVGTINYTDLQDTNNSYRTDLGIQNVEVKNIKSEEELNTWAVGMMAKIALQEMFKPQPQRKTSGSGWDSVLKLLGK